MSDKPAKPAGADFPATGLRLRPLSQGDLAMTLAWRNRDGVRQRFISTDPIAPEAHQAWFERYLCKADDVVYLAEELPAGPPIGQLAIYDIDPAAGQAEIGRFIANPERAGQGRMRAALQCLLELARSSLRLRRLVLSVRADNERAIRLYAGLGFVETARDSDMVHMSLGL